MYADRNCVDTTPDIHILQKRLFSNPCMWWLCSYCFFPKVDRLDTSVVEGDFRSICDSLAIVEHAGPLRDSSGESPGGLEIGESKEGERKTKKRTGVSQVACTENFFVSVRRSGSQKRDETSGLANVDSPGVRFFLAQRCHEKAIFFFFCPSKKISFFSRFCSSLDRQSPFDLSAIEDASACDDGSFPVNTFFVETRIPYIKKSHVPGQHASGHRLNRFLFLITELEESCTPVHPGCWHRPDRSSQSSSSGWARGFTGLPVQGCHTSLAVFATQGTSAGGVPILLIMLEDLSRYHAPEADSLACQD